MNGEMREGSRQKGSSGRAGTKPARSMELRFHRALWVWSKSRPEGVHGKHTPTTSLLRCLNPNCTKFTSFTCSEVGEGVVGEEG